MFHLLQSGLRIPKDISLVLGDSHPLIDIALPEIALKPSLIIPTFIAGSTLGAPPAAGRDSG